LKERAAAGVPLYLFLGAGAERPKILPQVLTESLILPNCVDPSDQALGDKHVTIVVPVVR